jgi:Flp pilus assembly protein TadD
MTKWLMIILIILLAVETAIMVSAQVQSSSSVPGIDASTAINAPLKNDVKILGIDPTGFPKLKINVFINRFCALTGSIKKDEFKVVEEGKDAVIDNLHFTGNASGTKFDLVVVFDDTESMSDELKALQSNVEDLTQKINSSKLDARYSLITFKRDVATKINWTSDAETLKRAVSKLVASGGSTNLPENSIGGIEKALSFGFRPDAQKVLIVVTDEPSYQKGDGTPNSTYAMEDAKKALLDSGVMLIAVSPDFRNPNVNPNVPRSDLPKYADMRDLSKEAGGLWIDIDSKDFSTILEQLKGIMTGTYIIEYASSDQTAFGNRTVAVAVNAPGCVVGSDLSFYIMQGSAQTSTGTVPNSSEFWYVKGHNLDLQGKYDEALQALDKAVELEPLYAEAWNGKGGALISLGRYDEALTAFDKAIELKPDFTGAWAYKGLALYRQGKYDESIQALDKAIELEPLYAEAWNGKSTDLISLGRYDEALQASERAIELKPDFAAAWVDKGLALKAMGRTSEADEAFAKAKELGYKG